MESKKDRNLAIQIQNCTAFSIYPRKIYTIGALALHKRRSSLARHRTDLVEKAYFARGVGGLPFKNDGGTRRSFSGGKFVYWHRLGC